MLLQKCDFIVTVKYKNYQDHTVDMVPDYRLLMLLLYGNKKMGIEYELLESRVPIGNLY